MHQLLWNCSVLASRAVVHWSLEVQFIILSGAPVHQPLWSCSASSVSLELQYIWLWSDSPSASIEMQYISLSGAAIHQHLYSCSASASRAAVHHPLWSSSALASLELQHIGLSGHAMHHQHL